LRVTLSKKKDLMFLRISSKQTGEKTEIPKN